MILIDDSSQLKQELVDFSSLNAFSIANLNSVSEEVQQVSLIQRFVSSTIYSKSFKLIDVSVPNTNEMCNASQLAAKLLHHQSSCASRLAACAQRLKLHKTSCVFHLVAPAKCHNKSNAFAFRLIVRFIQKSFQSRLHQDLVDLSLSNTFSISKLDSISIKAKSNSAMFNDLPMSQQKEIIHF
jgi:hypothetical protein